MGVLFFNVITSTIFNIINLFLVFWVFIAACRLSLVAVCRLLIAVASLVSEHGL